MWKGCITKKKNKSEIKNNFSFLNNWLGRLSASPETTYNTVTTWQVPDIHLTVAVWSGLGLKDIWLDLNNINTWLGLDNKTTWFGLVLKGTG